MRTETFTEELLVELTEVDRDLRGRQASRLSVALRAHQERAKEAKKKLAEDEKALTKALHEAADAAELGEEKRQVECYERLSGHVVQTIRRDTAEVLGSRAATKAELQEHEDEPLVPGGGARH